MDLPSSFKQLPICFLGHHSSSHMVLQHTSYAQVARWVSPQDGVTNACGLKPEKKKRKNPLTVRLSDSEREFIKAKTLAAGCSLNSYIRASILGSKYKPPTNPELLRALLAVNKELTSQGNNLNQISC